MLAGSRDLGMDGGTRERICLQCRIREFDPGVRKIPWRREGQPAPELLPGEPHGQRSLADYGPWGHKHPHRTEPLNVIEYSHTQG